MLFPTYTSRYDPFAQMRSMLRDLDGGFRSANAQPLYPAVNVWQNEEAVAITAEIPGVDPEDIDITVKDNVLTLAGERKTPDVPEGATWHRNERGYGKFSRAVRLPFAASGDDVEARFRNGVLRVVIGRPEEDKPRKIEIKAV